MGKARRTYPGRTPGWLLLVREDVSEHERRIIAEGPCRTSQAIHDLVKDRITTEVVEVMYVVGLDGRNHVLFCQEVARGGLHGCSILPRDVLRVACATSASAMILVHNHPSGDPTPSSEDITATRAIADAANAVGIPLVDHVIVGSTTRWSSMLDMGIISPK
jgi:DNA repair protein RadC